MLKNLYQDYITKDLILDTNFNLKWTSNLAEFVSQKIENVLSFVLNEWWLNIELGLDYYGTILIKNPDINYINSLFAREIINRIPEITSIKYLNVIIDTQNRSYSARFSVTASEVVVTGAINNIINQG